MNTPGWRIFLAVPLLTLSLSVLANLGGDEDGATKDPNFAVGRQAIDAQDWTAAVAAMQKVIAAEPKNAEAYNWLGFAQRKQGQYDAAFYAYKEALRLNPNSKSVHEYIGEAYLATDQLPKAEEHLAALTRLCSPIPCEELKDLQRAINEYKKKKK